MGQGVGREGTRLSRHGCGSRAAAKAPVWRRRRRHGVDHTTAPLASPRAPGPSRCHAAGRRATQPCMVRRLSVHQSRDTHSTDCQRGKMSRNRLCQAGTTRPCTAIWAVDALPPGLLSENRSTLNFSLGHTRPSPPSSHGLGGPGHRPKAPWGTMPHRPWQGFPRPQVGTPTGRHPPLTDWAGGWGRKWLWTHGQQISAALNYICCHQTHVIPLPPPPFPILGSRVWGGG